MPVISYEVKIILTTGKVHTGIRELDPAIDAQTYFSDQAAKHYKNIKEVKVWLTTKIPVEFDFEGRHYKGHLDPVSGAAAEVWHLMINKHYWGALMKNHGQWVFHPTPKDEGLKDYAEYFGNCVSSR